MSEMVAAGVELMVTGMAIVFIFLAALVVAVNLLAKLVERFFSVQQVSNSSAPASISSEANNAGIVAAITAAVTQYRKDHQ
jgi:oxaloacetate decarboxylase (Na+ extruding) subunit gamma